VRRAAVLVFACAAAGVAHADVDAELAAAATVLPACDAARPHCIGIRLHITVSDDGLIARPDFLATQLAAANRHFAPLDLGFQVVGIDSLPATAAHIATPGDRDAVAAGRLGGGVIHVFIVGTLDDVDRPGQIIRGVTWHTRDDDRKYIIVSTVAPERVLAHELGHFFGLPHSTYKVSIMNKRERKDPPPEQRTFADEEIAAMRTTLGRLLRAKVIAEAAK
jgi:hypothetical protein